MTAPRSTLDYLEDILDAVEKIQIFTRGMSYEERAALEAEVEGRQRAGIRSMKHWDAPE